MFTVTACCSGPLICKKLQIRVLYIAFQDLTLIFDRLIC